LVGFKFVAEGQELLDFGDDAGLFGERANSALSSLLLVAIPFEQGWRRFGGTVLGEQASANCKVENQGAEFRDRVGCVGEAFEVLEQQGGAVGGPKI
jgi:hypothetical protein